MGFALGSPFGSPYYLGGGTTTIVPYIAEVALDGHPYRIDWSAEVPLDFAGIDELRPQSDQSTDPGEQSINRDAYWRRSAESWHVGAGQVHYDRTTSNRYRFRESQGINIWNDFEFSLLYDIDNITLTAATNQKMAVAGGRLYYLDGTALKYITTLLGGPPPSTTITGTPGTAASSIASDGFNVWTAHGASGIYKNTRTTGTTASHITGTVSLLGFVRGRVMAGNNNAIYDVTTLAVGGGGALPAALYTHGNTDFVFTGFAEGSSYIYAAGFSGDKSLIFRIHIKEDGSGLDAPIVAGELPDGEIIRTIYGYLGRFIAIGTDKGFRLAIQGSGGDLIIGALVTTPAPVYAFEGQGEFIWYSLSAFSSSPAFTGIGRMSTQQFSDLDNLVPAYASDLMVSGLSSTVYDIVTFENKRVFTLNGFGMVCEDTSLLVSEGYIDSGFINFNLTEPKVGLFIESQHTGEAGEHEVLVSVDGGSFVSLGMHIEGVPFNVGQITAENFEIRNVLMRDGSDTSLGLTVHSWLLRALPQPSLTDYIYVTIFLSEQTESLVDSFIYYNIQDEIDHIQSLYRAKSITVFQVGNISESVVVENYRIKAFEIDEGLEGGRGMNISCSLKLKKVF